MRGAELLDPDPRDLALVRGYPSVPWLQPVSVSVFGNGPRRYACRICIARYGLRGADVASLYPTELEVEAHLRSFHNLEVACATTY